MRANESRHERTITARVACEKTPVRVACAQKRRQLMLEGRFARVGPYTIRRAGDLEEGGFEPSAGEVDRHGSAQDQVRVSRVQEPLFLVLLQRQDGQVEVERHEPDREADSRVSLHLGNVARVAEPLRVDRERHQDRRKRQEREGQQDVEVDETVQEVEVPRLGPVEFGTGSGDGEQVVLDDVEGHDRELLVCRRVDEDDRDLRVEESLGFSLCLIEKAFGVKNAPRR